MAASDVTEALGIAGTLLRLVVTVVEAVNRPDIAKPVRDILATFGTELDRTARSEAAKAAAGDGGAGEPFKPRPG